MAESSWVVGVIGAVGAGVTTWVAIAISVGDGKVTAGASCWVAGVFNGASAATGSAAGSGATGVGSGTSPSTSWTVRTTSSMPTCDLTR